MIQSRLHGGTVVAVRQLSATRHNLAYTLRTHQYDLATGTSIHAEPDRKGHVYRRHRKARRRARDRDYRDISGRSVGYVKGSQPVKCKTRGSSRTREGGDHPMRHLAYQVIPAVGNIQDPLAVESQPRRTAQLRQDRRPVVARGSRDSCSSCRREVPIPSQAVHPLSAEIRDVQIPVAIESQIARRGQRHCARWTSLVYASRRQPPTSRDGCDGSVRSHPAHPRVSQIRDVQVSLHIQSQTVRRIELRLRGWSAITRKTPDSRARHGLDHSV